MTGGTIQLARNSFASKDGATVRVSGAALHPVAAAGPLWVFGYGSLIWKTNFPYEDRVVGRVRGYSRKFWQGDVDHRGVPGAPGRVATLVQKDRESTWGVAFKISSSEVRDTLTYLNTREQGYSMHNVTFYPCKRRAPITVVAYIGTEESPSYLGPASVDKIARQVVNTRGCSGPNSEYVLNLASSMREIAPDVNDEHLFTLEARIKALLVSSSSLPLAEQGLLRVDGIVVGSINNSSRKEAETVSHNRESSSLSVL